MVFLQPQTDHFSRSDASKEAPNDTRWSVPELLAPAGNWDCARAAVENGADAIGKLHGSRSAVANGISS